MGSITSTTRKNNLKKMKENEKQKMMQITVFYIKENNLATDK